MSKGEFFKWSQKLSVGSVEIDDQHKKLLSMLNELYDAFMKKEHIEKIGQVIEQMKEYTTYHFKTEERYFSKFNYSLKHEHILEHIEFKNKVDEFAARYKKNSGALTYDIMVYLKSWLNSHIMETDQKYVECFRKNGVV